MSQLEIPLEHDLAPLINDEIPLKLPLHAPSPGSNVAHRMSNIEADLLGRAGGLDNFKTQTGRLIREAIDYVIDAPTLARHSVDELEPDEKTAIGKRIERLLRNEFKIERGEKLDIFLGGEDVDIKTTMSNKWMFSKSSWDHINLLIAYDESSATYSAGLAHVVATQLGAENRDSKRTMKSEFYEQIHWIVRNARYPENFLAKLDPVLFETIRSKPDGQKRVNALLEHVPGKVIPRHAISSLANQLDPQKRIRNNGGARAPLWKKGILVLSGKYVADRQIAADARNVILEADQYMSLYGNDPRVSKEMLSLYCLEHKL